MTEEGMNPRPEELFVERMGEFYTQMAMPRIAGRLLGWLLICDPPQQSADEIEAAVGASKASISTMLRMLMVTQCVERIGLPGERKVFYQIRPELWTDMLQERASRLTELRKMAEEGLEALADAAPERRKRLEAMRELHAFFEAEWPEIIGRWEKRKRE